MRLCERQRRTAGEEKEDDIPGVEHEFRFSSVRRSSDPHGDSTASREEGGRMQHTGAESR